MDSDKDAIRELLHLYCFHMDEGRFAELAALFDADAPARHASALAAPHKGATDATTARSATESARTLGPASLTMTAAPCFENVTVPSSNFALKVSS